MDQPPVTQRFGEAARFACDLHRSQRRKASGLPYVSHLLAVAALVFEDGGSEDEAIAALLHDAIEDQGDSYPGGRAQLRLEIENRFGRPVLDIVNGCTDDDGRAKGMAATAAEEAARWRSRKQAYLAHLETASPSILRVSCADKLHNARSILADYREHGDAVWLRFRTRSREDQLWYYRVLKRIFQERHPGRISAQFCDAVSELESAIHASRETAGIQAD